tara:strand:- start:890 stop:1957 length:1068 start_codon:yes stop_codon:yes gene_type:complete
MSRKPSPYQVFDEGDELYQAMMIDINQATKSICLESYIFSGDEIGWQIANALIERAQAGTQVRVHLDSVGTLLENTRSLTNRLRLGGVELHWFNSWRWQSPQRFNRRNHRKLLLIDECIVYVGGFNIHRESSRRVVGLRRWSDIHVRGNRYLGPHAQHIFDSLWDHKRLTKPPAWRGDVRLLPNENIECRRVLYCALLDAIAKASSCIHIATPYFVPDRRFRSALCEARNRGVKVKVLIPLQTDNRLVQLASLEIARSLTRYGIAFYVYQPRMLHAKLMLIDDSWATVGSANTDYRSFFVNLELNLFTTNVDLCHRLRLSFANNLAAAKPLDGFRGRWLPRALGRLVSYWGRRYL